MKRIVVNKDLYYIIDHHRYRCYIEIQVDYITGHTSDFLLLNWKSENYEFLNSLLMSLDYNNYLLAKAMINGNTLDTSRL